MLDKLRALWSDRDLPAAWTEYRQLATTGEAGPEGHLIGCLVAQAMNDFLGARQAIEQAAEAGPQGRLLGQIRFNRGIVRLHLGDVSGAIDQFTGWLEGVDAYPELVPFLLGSVHYNRGLVYHQSGRYKASLAAYRAACEEFQKENMKQLLCRTLQNLAWVACLARDSDEAACALAVARPLCTTDALRWHQRIGEVFLELVTPGGDRYQAAKRCEALMAHAGDDMPLPVRAHACWLAGRTALELGQIDLAEGLTRQALLWGAIAENQNRCLYDAAELLREIMVVRGVAERL